MINPAVRSGYVAAKSADITPPSEMPSSAALFDPAASITARTSSMRCSRLGRGCTRSDIPQPRLSNRIRRENEARRCRNAAIAGSSLLGCGGVIGEEHDARAKGLRVGDCQRDRRSLLEEALPAAKDDRIDQESKLVEQMLLEKAAYQFAAAEDKQVLACLILEPGNFFS